MIVATGPISLAACSMQGRRRPSAIASAASLRLRRSRSHHRRFAGSLVSYRRAFPRRVGFVRPRLCPSCRLSRPRLPFVGRCSSTTCLRCLSDQDQRQRDVLRVADCRRPHAHCERTRDAPEHRAVSIGTAPSPRRCEESHWVHRASVLRGDQPTTRRPTFRRRRRSHRRGNASVRTRAVRSCGGRLLALRPRGESLPSRIPPSPGTSRPRRHRRFLPSASSDVAKPRPREPPPDASES
jgi:hypothetical protein